ncbi:MAG: GGDEF domain-containing protein [Lachnospiraceae bacterium]|jgi:diguanylate cyclase (GGDEF)-like protein
MEREKRRTEQRQQIRRSAAAPALALALMVVVLMILLEALGLDDIPYVNVTSQVRGSIYDAEGNLLEEDLSPISWVVQENESLVVTVPLPEKAPFPHSNALVFSAYNADLTVLCGGRELLREALPPHRLSGNRLLRCDIPDYAWGGNLIVKIATRERLTTSYDTLLFLMPSEDVRLYPLIYDAVPILLFMAIAVLSMLMFLYTLLLRLLQRKREGEGIYLFLFCFLLSLWYLGCRLALYVVSMNDAFNATAEYYAVYLAPIPAMVYFCKVTASRRFRLFCRILAIAFSVNAAAMFAVSLSPAPWTMSDLIFTVRTLLGIMLAGFIVRAVQVRHLAPSPEKTILTGLAVSAAITLIEIPAIAIRNRTGVPEIFRKVLNFDYASVGILLFISVLLISYVNRLQEDLAFRIHERELEHFAFEDPLTGIPNRQSLIRQLKEIEEPPLDLTVVFLDVDGLKKTNDSQGHEAGDLLLTTVADCIGRAAGKIESAHLFGRWGGDEFLVFFEDGDAAGSFMARLQEEIDAVNKEGNLPFAVSVSAGLQSIQGEDGTRYSIDEMIRRADARMYEVKREHHRQRET